MLWGAELAAQTQLLHKRQAPAVSSLNFQTKGPTVKSLSSARISARALRGEFRLEIEGTEFLAVPNPLGFRGVRRSKSAEKFNITYTGALHFVDPSKAALDYGSYIVTDVLDLQSRERVVAGSLRTPDGRYLSFTSKYKRGRPWRAILRQHASTDQFSCATRSSAVKDHSVAKQNGFDGVSALNNPNVRVLVAYTRSALALMGNNHNQVQAVVNYEMAKLQQSATDSNLGYNFEAAGLAYFIDEVEGSPASVITRLYTRGEPENYGEAIFAEMQARNADLIHLLVDGWDAGFAGVAVSPMHSFSIYKTRRGAFCASNINSTMFAGSRIFAHETGHVLGAMHDPANVDAHLGIYTDARGHHVIANNQQEYATIMSYGRPTTNHSLHQFSDPNITFLGAATGISGQRDNARLMRETGPIVAQYRSFPMHSPGGSFEYSLTRGAEDSYPRISFRYIPSQVPNLAEHGRIQIRALSNGIESSPFEIDYTTAAAEYQMVTDGQYAVALYPDLDVRSAWIAIPNVADISLSIERVGNKLTGQATAGGISVTYGGAWVSIVKYLSEGGFEVVATVEVDSAGKFSYSPTAPGTYAAAHFANINLKLSQHLTFDTISGDPVEDNQGRTGKINIKRASVGANYKLTAQFTPSDTGARSIVVSLACDGAVVSSKRANKKGLANFTVKSQKKARTCQALVNQQVRSNLVKIPKRQKAKKT